MSTALKSFINCNLNIAKVVECVENTDNINAVFNALSDKGSYDVIGIVLVSEKILTSEKHLKHCVGTSLSDFAKSLPRIFINVTKA